MRDREAIANFEYRNGIARAKWIKDICDNGIDELIDEFNRINKLGIPDQKEQTYIAADMYKDDSTYPCQDRHRVKVDHAKVIYKFYNANFLQIDEYSPLFICAIDPKTTEKAAAFWEMAYHHTDVIYKFNKDFCPHSEDKTELKFGSEPNIIRVSFKNIIDPRSQCERVKVKVKLPYGKSRRIEVVFCDAEMWRAADQLQNDIDEGRKKMNEEDDDSEKEQEKKQKKKRKNVKKRKKRHEDREKGGTEGKKLRGTWDQRRIMIVSNEDFHGEMLVALNHVMRKTDIARKPCFGPGQLARAVKGGEIPYDMTTLVLILRYYRPGAIHKLSHYLYLHYLILCAMTRGGQYNCKKYRKWMEDYKKIHHLV